MDLIGFSDWLWNGKGVRRDGFLGEDFEFSFDMLELICFVEFCGVSQNLLDLFEFQEKVGLSILV